MKRFLITALFSVGFLLSVFAQNVTFTLMKNDGTTVSHVMTSDASLKYSDTQLFLVTNGETITYDLSALRKGYFTVDTDVKEIDNQQLTIYPNPAKDVLKISNISDNQEVTIYSINGALIKRIIASGDAEINISELHSGMYVVKAGNMYSKFIKM